MKIAYNIFHTDQNDIFRNSLYESSLYVFDSNYPKLDTPTVFFYNDTEAEKFIIDNRDFNPIDTFKRGEIGIWASNYLSWKNFLDSDYDVLINLEDDGFVQSDFSKKLDMLLKELPSDWDILSLHCPPSQINRHSEEISISNNLSKPFQTWSALCYLISKKGAKKVLDYVERGFYLPIDIFFYKSQKYLNVYNIKPDFGNFVALVNTTSTIQNSPTRIDLKRNFYSNYKIWNDLHTKASKVNLIQFVYDEEDINILYLNLSNQIVSNILIFCNSKIQNLLAENFNDDRLKIVISEDLPNYKIIITNVNGNFGEIDNLNIILNQSISIRTDLIRLMDINFLHKWYCLSIDNHFFVFKGSIDDIKDAEKYYPFCDDSFISKIDVSGYNINLLPGAYDNYRSLLGYRLLNTPTISSSNIKEIFHSRKLNKKVALENLKDITTILENYSVRHWLQDGTLLGLLREGDFIQHDYDTDIGITSESMRPEVIFKLLEKNFMIPIIHGYLKDGFIISLKRNGVKTDLFFYYERGSDFYHSAFVGPLGAKRKIDYIYKKFDVKKIEFLGHQFYTPEDPLYFILTKYGNTWQIPDTTWGFAFSPKNHRLTDVYINYEKAKQEFEQWLNLEESNNYSNTGSLHQISQFPSSVALK